MHAPSWQAEGSAEVPGKELGKLTPQAALQKKVTKTPKRQKTTPPHPHPPKKGKKKKKEEKGKKERKKRERIWL